MDRLINDDGQVRFGIFESPVDEINYRDYPLTTPMGFKIPAFVRNLMFNQFVFFGLTGPDVIVGMAVVDLKYLSNGFLYVYDRKDNTVTEAGATTLPISRKIFIDPTPENVSCGFALGKLAISMADNTITAAAKDIDIHLAIVPAATKPLRIATRAGYTGWVYTQKTTPINVSGEVLLKGRRIPIASPSHMGLMDWTAGYMRRKTFWNWAASAATLPDGRSFGMNLACEVNETSFTENAFWIDGKMTKVDMVQFEFNPENFYAPWHVTSRDGKIDLTFTGAQQRSEHINAGLVATKFTQLMGEFEGALKTGDNKTIHISHCPGWAEDHYAKW